MSDSIALRIVDALEASLVVATVAAPGGTLTKPTGLVVHGHRLRPTVAEAGALVIVVYRLTMPEPVDDRTGLLDWVQPVAVETRLRLATSASAEPPDDQMDPAYTWVLAAVMADPTFGGLANDTTIGQLQITYEEAGAAFAVWYQEFRCQFQTLRDDPRSAV